MSVRPWLSGVVVHWGEPRELGELVGAWPEDPRFELVVVDNGPAGAGGRAGREVWRRAEGKGRVVRTGGNLGFGGGANAGVQEAQGEVVLVLNPDVVPEPGALERLVEGFRERPEAAGLVPRMVGRDGEPQFAWQLRRLPSAWQLLAQAAGWPAAPEARREPAEGEAVEQPAAAALALRRRALETVGGFDPGFHPAWFEDVDLAKRLGEAGLEVLYWPRATVRHGLGGTVGQLGYGRFLWTYQRNLLRYLRKHHGAMAATTARLLVPAGLLLRLALLPLRKPQRATSRTAATRGLLGALAGALTGWRRPQRWNGATPEENRNETPGEERTGPTDHHAPRRDAEPRDGEPGGDRAPGTPTGGSAGAGWTEAEGGRGPRGDAEPREEEPGGDRAPGTLTGGSAGGSWTEAEGGRGPRGDAEPRDEEPGGDRAPGTPTGGSAGVGWTETEGGRERGGGGVSVCIVTRDSVDDVAPCFAAVAALHHRPLEVVLVDCGSSDGTVEAAAEHRRVLKAAGVPLHLRPLGENRGFAGGMNAALEIARAPWVLSLNADARPAPDYLERLLERAAAHPELRIGALTGRLTRLPAPERSAPLPTGSPVGAASVPAGERPGGTGGSPGEDPDAPSGSRAAHAAGDPLPHPPRLAPPAVLDACGMRLTRTWRHLDRGSGEPDRGQYDRAERVFGATGAASLFRRAALDDAALEGDAFDPLFHSFREDAELAFRLRERGWEVLYEPAARAGHRRFNLPERRRAMPPEVNRHSLKNRYLLRLYHQTARNLLVTLVPTLSRDLAALGYALLRERSSLPAYGWLWRHRRQVLARRRTIQARRTVPARELDRWFGREGMPL